MYKLEPAPAGKKRSNCAEISVSRDSRMAKSLNGGPSRRTPRTRAKQLMDILLAVDEKETKGVPATKVGANFKLAA